MTLENGAKIEVHGPHGLFSSIDSAEDAASSQVHRQGRLLLRLSVYLACGVAVFLIYCSVKSERHDSLPDTVD
ncbi:hypothetical protein BDW59DRAFT_45505 [Aspergillus cavernicola]|uniref:Uncharacterized protein n=1 Tax=Aspergillus cavernicola TaxID=176166 RepID=A0ABR4J2Q7_9EURO